MQDGKMGVPDTNHRNILQTAQSNTHEKNTETERIESHVDTGELTISPKDASGFSSLTRVRLPCEYKKKADMARLGRLGS